MKLAKSKTSALLMSSTAVLSFALVSAILDILFPFLLGGDIRSILVDPQRQNYSRSYLALAGFVIVLLVILINIGAFWLYRYFGEAYYGKRGAIRWAAFGATFAILFQLPAWILPKLTAVKILWQVVSPFAAFGITRKLIPLDRTTPPQPE